METVQTTSAYGSPVFETTKAPETTAVPVAETTAAVSVKDIKLSKDEKKEDAFKNECVYLQFEDAYRNPQNYKDKKVHVQGTVTNIDEEFFVMTTNYDTGGVYAISLEEWEGGNFMAGDILDVYGLYLKAAPYTDDFGDTTEFVFVKLVYADRYVEITAETEIENEWTYYNPNMCVINVDEYTTLRQSPDPNAEEVAKLPLDSYVMSLDSTDDGWYYVMTEEGLEGYAKTIRRPVPQFFKQQDFNELKLSVKENHKILIDRLSKEDRKNSAANH
ncbi:SH3 domain-containing protein [Lacrimispora amygdalina]|uniref:SH3 domain-containing protein n=1 Tax=Lacrimispora amygdalina TaxID=253257 RepID=UPI001FA8B54E|nr:SH3 domain-containing protein [Lacrimispora amygdalina]